ncbi:4-(cytidine 5'-diphospho)-2-C-methyl-D-erythritol kinase [Sporolactobacillus spathodeae]|uniref:4-diphosphocytidyl-2-C-methyl-D-erythritol kinase n=1 Tax=Sporolactobacillus spathodeae TaxID=1465502 RepID=A0ABS2QAJ5_9BACL|nr:4-diphosphocytidyl-2-C-methyl-D-erythritol kinase [Sporolactobacillus spathodeae]
MKVLEKAPAKINLSLDVLGLRPDGYHEVRMVMTTIDLSDRVECESIPQDIILLHASESYIPEDGRNFAYQAADLIREKYGIKEGVRIFIQKKIPVAAGLAGGSSDAAATIRALNRLWSLEMTNEDMQEIAVQIGSDVAFCLHGGTALATGRGEIIDPLPDLPPCWVVLVKPDVSVSTAQVYRDWDDQEAVHPNVNAMISAVQNHDFQEICRQLGNTLEPVTVKKVADIARIKEHMRQIGAEGILMSGSGPTVFGLTQKESRMQRLFNGMKGYCREVHAVRLSKSLDHLSKYE